MKSLIEFYWKSELWWDHSYGITWTSWRQSKYLPLKVWSIRDIEHTCWEWWHLLILLGSIVDPNNYWSLYTNEECQVLLWRKEFTEVIRMSAWMVELSKSTRSTHVLRVLVVLRPEAPKTSYDMSDVFWLCQKNLTSGFDYGTCWTCHKDHEDVWVANMGSFILR